METMTDKINALAASMVEGSKDGSLTRRDNIYDCRKGDLIELDGGRLMIFVERSEKDKFKAIDKKTNVLYLVPNEKLLRIAQGDHRPDVEEDWQKSLKSGDLFYIFRQGRCELYVLNKLTPTHLECSVPHTDEKFRIRRGEYEGRRINGSLD